ncbi:hypothetical protein P7C71_g4919, partial [Lecanoromycetidae sp. Uapishka_2]
MAHAHNIFIRALNTIYNTAPHIHTPTDIRDLLFYGTCWYECVEHHHHAEETDLFPAIERIAGKPGLMEQNVEQHHAFHPGFYAFRDYCRDTTVETWDAKVLMGIMDGFSMVLQKHLAEEIETLLALDYCDSGALKKAVLDMEKKLMAGADKVSLLKSSLWCVGYGN